MTIRRAYIDRAAIAQPQLRFTWDEWNIKSTYLPVNEDEAVRLQKLSKRANCALTIGIAEWILARFAGMDADPDPAQFLEAAWAANVDIRYAYEIPIVDAEWRGPIRGPISMALTFVLDALFAEEAGENSFMNPAWAARFARHVLPDSKPFDAWFESCLERFESLYPAPSEDDADWFEPESNAGPLIPPEAVDPDRPFDPSSTDNLIDAFLRNLKSAPNDFLAPPEVMASLGFEGEPYQYPPG
jgi:hypothetical protein